MSMSETMRFAGNAEERLYKHRRRMQLWRTHGGNQHGPHVETVTMPLAKFHAFLDALIEQEKAALERNRG